MNIIDDAAFQNCIGIKKKLNVFIRLLKKNYDDKLRTQ